MSYFLFHNNSNSCILHNPKLFGVFFRKDCEKTIGVFNPAGDEDMNSFF